MNPMFSYNKLLLPKIILRHMIMELLLDESELSNEDPITQIT